MAMGVAAGLRGRANRKEYWLYIGALLAIGMLLAQIAPLLGLVGALVVLYAQIRRLHDLGRTGWWAGAVLLLQIPLAAILYYSLGEDMGIAVGNILILIPIVLIGLAPGQPQENRFGPPPGQRRLKDVFN